LRHLDPRRRPRSLVRFSGRSLHAHQGIDRLAPESLLDIGAIEAGGMHPHPDPVSSGLRSGALLDGHHFGSAVPRITTARISSSTGAPRKILDTRAGKADPALPDRRPDHRLATHVVLVLAASEAAGPES